ncbi:MAG: SpoIID/LytB domain-containing protein [Clostridiales bacterium]|nr:SpoIID/LytB domain-containing protein [Clostridiales bacterium]
MNSFKIRKIILSTIFILTLFVISCINVFASTNYIIDNIEHEYTGKEVTIKYENENMEFDVNPIIHNDRTLLPIRALVEKAGGTIEWNNDTREITIKLDDINILMQIGNKIAKVNNEEVELDVVPCIAYEDGNGDAGRTIVPLRFVMENLGLKVEWDQETYTVSIFEEKNNEIEQLPTGNININNEIKDSIRIGLYYDTTVLNKVTLKAKTKMYLGNVIDGEFETKLEINPNSTLILEIDAASNNYIKIWVDGKLVDGIEGVVQIIPEYNQNKEQRLTVNNSEYRGIIEVQRKSGGLRVINILSMQEYLYSVVPSEIESNSHIEAIKAQAVAARTYAVSQMNRHRDNEFDLCATTHCQMYRGTSWERSRSNQAVDETEGVVIRYNGKLISAFYFATSGGHTENVENVWSGNYPYLRGVEDSYEPKTDPWTKTYNRQEIEELLESKGVDIGILKGIKTDYTESGRVLKLTFIGTKGEKTFTKESTRLLFSLKSQMFTLELEDDRYDLLEKVIEKLENGEEVVIAKVVTQNLNFRENNTTDSESLAKLNTGELYEVIEIDGKWAKIIVGEQTGWVSTEYVELVEYAEDVLEDLKEEYNNPDREYTIKITGYGSGHGVGMSQNGAKGMANAGFTYDEILKHYYTGVTVE